jgi:copper(I)-binding protein
MRRALAALILLAAAAAAVALALRGGDGARGLLVEDAVAAALEGRPGEAAVFLTLRNSGPPDRLVAVHSGAARAARIASGEAEAAVPVPGGGEAALAPDAAHVRLQGVEGGLAPGRMLPLTLVFERAGEVSARARVAAPQPVGEAGDFRLAGLGGVCRVGEGEPAPRVSLSAEPRAGGGWTVRVAAEDFAFRRDLADGLHVPGTGHGHLYVGGAKLGRLYAPEAEIGPLPPGRHVVRVTLNTNDHRAYVVDGEAVSAAIEIVSEGEGE